jgi:hypothetical protein
MTLAFAPATHSDLGISLRSGASTPLYFDAVTPTVSGSTLIFPETPISLELYRNGLLQLGGVTSSQLPYVEAIINFFKPARCLLDEVAVGGSDTNVDYVLSGNVATLTVAPGDASFLAWGTYAGSGTAQNFADWITPAGLINGSNTTFTLPQSPSPAGSLKLYHNWMLLKEGPSFSDTTVDYTLSGLTVTYRIAPLSGSTHLAFYIY